MNPIDQLCQQLKEQLSASQVAGQVLQIKKSGAGFTALCPFHKDTMPSLHITDSKGFIKCFACGGGGDIISFWQQYHNLENAGKAAISLAKAFLVAIPNELLEPTKKGSATSANNANFWRITVAKLVLSKLKEIAAPQSVQQELAGAFVCPNKPFSKSVLKAIRQQAASHTESKVYQFPELNKLSSFPAGTIYTLYGNASRPCPTGFMWVKDGQKKTVFLFPEAALISRTTAKDTASESPYLAVLFPNFDEWLLSPIKSHSCYLYGGFSMELACSLAKNYFQMRQLVICTNDLDTAIDAAITALKAEVTLHFYDLNTHQAVLWYPYILNLSDNKNATDSLFRAYLPYQLQDQLRQQFLLRS